MTQQEPIHDSSGNVFADLGFEPEEAENLRLRADLMIAIKTHIKEQGWTQQEAARHFGVAQPRISEICRCQIGLFTVDKLVNLLARVGRRVSLQVHAPLA
ncbi:MAG: helix-turn-helix transcriptional regulator [Candidatus Latescibacterota bacterium]